MAEVLAWSRGVSLSLLPPILHQHSVATRKVMRRWCEESLTLVFVSSGTDRVLTVVLSRPVRWLLKPKNRVLCNA